MLAAEGGDAAEAVARLRRRRRPAGLLAPADCVAHEHVGRALLGVRAVGGAAGADHGGLAADRHRRGRTRWSEAPSRGDELAPAGPRPSAAAHEHVGRALVSLRADVVVAGADHRGVAVDRDRRSRTRRRRPVGGGQPRLLAPRRAAAREDVGRALVGRRRRRVAGGAPTTSGSPEIADRRTPNWSPAAPSAAVSWACRLRCRRCASTRGPYPGRRWRPPTTSSPLAPATAVAPRARHASSRGQSLCVPSAAVSCACWAISRGSSVSGKPCGLVATLAAALPRPGGACRRAPAHAVTGPSTPAATIAATPRVPARSARWSRTVVPGWIEPLLPARRSAGPRGAAVTAASSASRRLRIAVGARPAYSRAGVRRPPCRAPCRRSRPEILHLAAAGRSRRPGGMLHPGG